MSMSRKIFILILISGVSFFLNANLFQNEDTIKYDGANSSGFGLPNGGTFYAAVRFHPQQSCILKSIIFYQYQPVMTGCWIYLHEEGQPTIPGQKIDSISYLGMPGPSTWIRLNFSTPHFRAGGVDFWIIVKITHTAGQTPLGIDAGPSVIPPRSFVSADGIFWRSLRAIGQDNNFNIRAIVRYIQPGFDIGIDEILINSISPPNVTMNLEARIKNYGISFPTNIPVACSILGPGGVLRYANILTITSLAPGDTIRFSFGNWTPTIIEETTIIMRLLINDEVPANDREVLVLTYNYNYYEDFEFGNGSYTPDPLTGAWTWQPGFWATVSPGANANWKLHSVPFTSYTTNPQLRFTHRYDMEYGWDGGNVKISTNNGVTWILVSPVGGYPGYVGSGNAGIPGESCYTGTHTTSTEAIFNLPIVSGQRFFMRWHFGSDNSVTYPGWYIDDVTGIGFIAQSPATHDVGIDAVISPVPNHQVNTPIVPTVRVRNYGTANENFPVVCSIVGTGGALRYTNTQTVTALGAGIERVVDFDPWTPVIAEVESFRMRTLLVDDQYPENDRVTGTVTIGYWFLNEGFNDSIFPPPGWQSVIIQGTYNWYRATDTSGIVPVYEGTGMACYPSGYAVAGSQARLITPLITLTSPWRCTLKFYMYHDPAYPGSFLDSVKIETSTDGTNFTRVAAFRRYEATAQWTEHTVYLGNFSVPFYVGFLGFSGHGNNNYIDFVRLSAFSGVAENKINNVPLITMLNSPKPNPMTNGIAQISFTLAEPLIVSLKIYDASGRLIKTLTNTQLGIGVYSYTWDSKDDNNRKVAEGVYFYTLETSKQKFCRKMILM